MIRNILGAAAVAALTLTAAACDRSAQPADGAVGKGEVGTAANTPSGQVVPTTGTNDAKVTSPEIDPAAVPASGAGAADTSTAPASK